MYIQQRFYSYRRKFFQENRFFYKKNGSPGPVKFFVRKKEREYFFYPEKRSSFGVPHLSGTFKKRDVLGTCTSPETSRIFCQF
jgi:hypothetical protein